MIAAITKRAQSLGCPKVSVANKAYSLYLRQNPAEQAKLLKMVRSNCRIDVVNITPTYRKPFDLIFEWAKN